MTASQPEIKVYWKHRSDPTCDDSHESKLDPCRKARTYLSAFKEDNAAIEWSAFYSNMTEKSLTPILNTLRPILTGKDTECFLNDIEERVSESYRTLKALFDEELDLYPDQYYRPCLLEFLYEWFSSSREEAIEDFYLMFDYSLELFRDECERMYKQYVRQILCILEIIELTILTPEERETVSEVL